MSDEMPRVEFRKNGPIIVKNVKEVRLADGSLAEQKSLYALCRCGKSANKPYCDGSHNAAEFDGSSSDVASRDRVYSYEGRDATVYYNKLLCSHAGECGKRALEVFNPKAKPWVQPDNGTVEQIKEVITACPSGALRMSLPGAQPYAIASAEVSVSVEPNGPYHVKNIVTEAPYWADGQETKKYVLCRCGLSQNKPFCDGTHHDLGWKEND